MGMPGGRRSALLACGLVLAMTACSSAAGSAGPVATSPGSLPGESVPQQKGPTVLAAAGDISLRSLGHQRGTARLVERLRPARVLALGDLQYPRGDYPAFRRYYDPTWGRFKDITLPAPGNHEYLTPHAAGYFRYFGDRARRDGRSYYSVDVARWHIVSLNSNIAHDGASPQLRWLRQDLADTSRRCILAFWHSPRFNSGLEHGNDPSVAPFWHTLYAARADLVLNGHEHVYERFARQTPTAQVAGGGIREFVVGTGGAETYAFGPAEPNSQRQVAGRYGVLRLALRPTSYAWRFVAANDQVLDRGGPVTCH